MADESPHNELQSIVDHLERDYGDEEYDGFDDEFDPDDE